MMQALNGFVKIHRKLIAWGWYQDTVVKSVFLHILLTANFKDVLWKGHVIKRGQLVTSVSHMADVLGFSSKQIRTAFSKLKATGEVAIKTTNKYTLITVANWEDYQLSEDEGANKKTNKGQSKDKQKTIKGQQMKKDKNIRIKEYNGDSPLDGERAPKIPDWQIAGFSSEQEHEAWLREFAR